MSKFVKLAVVYLVATFPIAAGWHLVLFKSTYDELAIFSRTEPLIPLGLTAMLIQACIMAFLFPIYVGSDKSVAKGVKFGIIMGIFMASSAVFAEAGKQNVTSLPTWIILESIYYLVQFSIVGLLMALANKTTRSES